MFSNPSDRSAPVHTTINRNLFYLRLQWGLTFENCDLTAVGRIFWTGTWTVDVRIWLLLIVTLLGYPGGGANILTLLHRLTCCGWIVYAGILICWFWCCTDGGEGDTGGAYWRPSTIIMPNRLITITIKKTMDILISITGNIAPDCSRDLKR